MGRFGPGYGWPGHQPLGKVYGARATRGRAMGLTIRASAHGPRQRVVHPGPGPTTVYVCGPTVYGEAHVGHARTYLVFDVARRQLGTDGRRVRTVVNVTDFEDKITDRARALGLRWLDLARRSERDFFRELAALRILPPDVRPRASDHVDEMRRVIRRLDRAGRVVRRDGGLYFRPRPRRGRAETEGAIAHVVPDGRSPTATRQELAEFALWLPPHEDGPAWPSPWGPGTPGWHLECYVMARRYLGLPVDLHGGGTDLAFPHHYAERELTETLDRGPFARRYLYAGFVTQGGAKMAKSTGNLVTLRTALGDAGADGLRWYLLERPYREVIEWSPARLAAAAGLAARSASALHGAIPRGAGGSASLASLEALVRRVRADLGQDLATGRALARVAEFAEALDRRPRGVFPRGSQARVRAALREIGERLGFDWAGPARSG
jgi:cysteinyl-tRNA synthetase